MTASTQAENYGWKDEIIKKIMSNLEEKVNAKHNRQLSLQSVAHNFCGDVA